MPGNASSIGSTSADQRDKNTPSKSPQEKADEAKVAIASRKKLLALAGENGLDDHDFVRQLQSEVDALEKKQQTREVQRSPTKEMRASGEKSPRGYSGQSQARSVTGHCTGGIGEIRRTIKKGFEWLVSRCGDEWRGGAHSNGRDRFPQPRRNTPNSSTRITTEFIKRKAAQGDTPEQRANARTPVPRRNWAAAQTIAFRGMNRSFWILSILLFQITSASGAAIGSPPVMTSGARLQSARNECAVIAAATVAAAAVTNATVYKGEEGRKFTTAERQALGCQCVASCYHFREYNPWPYRFP